MGNRKLVIHLVSFIIYLTVQVLFMKNWVLYDTAFCFIYIAFLLLLPVELPITILMILGFFTGLSVDIFYDSLGIHASASVLIMFVRQYYIRMTSSRIGMESADPLTLRQRGIEWFSIYAFVLILIHHLALFFIEVSGLGMFWFTFSKAFFSTLLTFIVVIISQYLFYSKKRAK